MQSASSTSAPIATMNKDVTLTTTTTTVEHHDNPEQLKANQAAYQANLMSGTDAIPHPVPTALLTEVEKAKGKVPHAHHVDVSKVEHSNLPVGHVVKDPTLLDKISAKLTGHSSSASSSTSTTSLPAHDNIPHAAIPDSTLQEIQKAKGSVPHAHHVDIKKVEAAHAPQVGHVKADPNILQRATEFLTQAVPAQRPNVPSSALAHTGILKEVESAKGHPAHAHHVDIAAVEAAHQPEGLGHVVDNKDTKLTTTRPAKDDKSFMDKIKDTFTSHSNASNTTTTATSTTTTTTNKDAFAAAAPAYSHTTVAPAGASTSAPVAANATLAAEQFSADPAIAKFNKSS